MVAVGLTLLWIAAGMILLGVVLMIVGAVLEQRRRSRGIGGKTDVPLMTIVGTALRGFVRQLLDPRQPLGVKVAAVGGLLFFFGVAILLIGAATWFIGNALPAGDPDPSATPTPTGT